MFEQKKLFISFDFRLDDWIFFLPTLLEWGGIPFTLADVIELIFGEPNQTSRTVVLILLVILLFFIIRSFYKQYKKLM
ncbi:hypothetical protein [Lysinibacillus fusiformis]|uniref:hypothetical protein n=1 Tax=Lysinibacillus fusiformis TaxID=28031 RepID=UPI003CF3C0B4